ncbi:MAG: YhbY family RNA-binding protein [Pseudomonadota bacterium]
MSLTERQRKTLRGLGHKLHPIVMIADKGLSAGVNAELESALDHHELIKVSVRAGEREERDALIKSLCDNNDAELVQRIGNTALIFRRNPDAPKVVLGSR